MKKQEFSRIRILKDEDDFIASNFEVGDIFLYGESMIKQVEVKNAGDVVTYYKVIDVGKSISYMPIMEKLESEEVR